MSNQPNALQISGSISLGKDADNMLNNKRIHLLEEIGNTGSISQAARQVGLSYKGAWDAVEAMNAIFGEPLVATMAGGKGGGGTQLTSAGIRIVDAYKALAREQRKFLEAASQGIQDFEDIYRLIKRLSVKTSARNQLFGKVSAIKEAPVNVEVTLTLTGGEKIIAVITHDGLNDLGLKIGSDAWGLVKASWIILATPEAAHGISARNKLLGKISRITHGGVNAEITLVCTGNNSISATLTNESVSTLQLKIGDEVCAVFKASSVILGVNE
jgi:molybdate transport system regulatory protein